MNPLYKYLGLLVLTLLILFGCYSYGRRIESMEQQLTRDKAIQAQQESNRKALIAYAETITKAGVQHDKDQRTINNLRDDLAGVSVLFSSPTVSGVPKASGGADPTYGVLSSSVDKSFARLQKRVGELMFQCDQLNIDVMRLNSELH